VSQATTAYDAINESEESIFPIQTTELISSLDDYDDDVAGWINYILDERLDSDVHTGDSPDLFTTEQHVAQLSTRLQVVMQDTAAQLEQTIDNISRTVPRLTYDLQFMREAGLSLQLTLKSVEDQSRISAADDPTSIALDHLHQLSTIKSRMEAAREVLQEAESWSVLESEVSSLITSEAYAKAGERLAEASRSMVVFQNTSEYENRRALMISLQNQLEAALSSALVAAINAKEVSTCRSFFTIFGNIQRETEFRNYYFGSRRADLVEMWQAASLTDCGATSSSPQSSSLSSESLPFVEFFRRFLSQLLDRVSEEQLSIPVIFPDAQASLSTFIQSTFDALTPSLSQRLAEMGEYHGFAAITEFIKAFRAAEEFALAVDQIMGKIGYSAFFLQSIGEDSGAGGAHGRRSSKRSSMSRRLSAAKSLSVSNTSILAGAGVTWEHALFEAFIDLQTEYAMLEKRFVDRELARLTFNQSVTIDPSRILQERSIAVFGLVEESLSRCMAFTHGYGAVGLINTTNYAFRAFLEKSQNELVPEILPAGQKRTSAYGGPNFPSAPSDTLEDFDYTPEDWSDFQLALHLIETCRVVRDRLNALELKFKATLIQASNTFHLGQGSADSSIISPNGTTRGEAELLTQSSLNSAELHLLLDSIASHSVGSLPSPSTSAPNSHATKSSPSVTLLEPSIAAIVRFTKGCQAFLQGVILKPLHAHLTGYAKSDTWSATAPKKATTGAFDLQLPSFSLSPSPTIQRVAEGLLNLPRLFEVYADDDALAFSVESLPFVDKESLQALLAGSGGPPELTFEDDHTSRPSAASTPSIPLRRLSSNSMTSTTKQVTPAAADLRILATLSPELVSSTWLNSLTLSLLSHLTSVVLPSIDSLSSSGCAQLASDLAYLSNIVRALNVEWDDLERWREAVEVSDEEGKKKWDAKRAEFRLGGRREAGYEVWEFVAKMRGGWDVAVLP
jgi:conserved oligomeric Golgi complex subunit 7